MSSDAVERLRSRIPPYYCGPIMREAAALIEARDAEIVRLQETVERLQRWQEEAALALDAATVIGKRHGTPLHFANHDRLVQEAAVVERLVDAWREGLRG